MDDDNEGEELEIFNERINWRSCELKIGDRVGVLVTSFGAPWIYQNGERVAESPPTIPISGPLYAVVDLLGSTSSVTYTPNAQPPQYFDHRLLGPSTEVSEEGTSARHMDSTGEELGGVVFCGSPIAMFPEGAYFEVRVDEVRDDQEDGLVVGVTLSAPEPFQELPKVGDGVLNSWSVGFDGMANQCGSLIEDANMTEIDWCGRSLKVGDRVGFFVNRGGEAFVIENGSPKAQLPGKLPMNVPLYPFFDLLGNTIKVTLVKDARPPAGVQLRDPPPAIGMSDSEGGTSSCAEGSKKGVMKRHKTFKGFDRIRVSRFVTLSGDGLSASHVDQQGDELCGVVFGDAPLKRFANGGAYFEVVVAGVRLESQHAKEDGLAIGVTTSLPKKDADPPMVADTLPGSWTFGYDGCFSIVPPEPEEEKSSKRAVCRFRSRDSTYRISRCNRSVYGDLHPKKKESKDGGYPSTADG